MKTHENECYSAKKKNSTEFLRQFKTKSRPYHCNIYVSQKEEDNLMNCSLSAYFGKDLGIEQTDFRTQTHCVDDIHK